MPTSKNNTKSPKVSYEEKIQDKVNRLWRSWRKRYDYPDHFEYFVPHRIYDLVLSEVRKDRKDTLEGCCDKCKKLLIK